MLQVEDRMHVVAERGFPDHTRAMQMLIQIRKDDVFEQIYKTNQPVIIDDVTESPWWFQQEWLEWNYSWMGVPIILLDKVIGMLSLTRKERNAFSYEDAALALAFAKQAALLLESARLYDKMSSLNDELERKVQERTDELAKAYRKLERLDKTKADFIGVAAHELRTPLTVVSGYANMLSADPAIKDKPSSKALMDGILGGIARMLQVINSILDVTRVDSDVVEMKKNPTRFSMIFERIQREFAPALKERQLTLDLVNVAALPTVFMDTGMMYKVFYHLVNNAIKYTPDGGRITVTGKAINTPELGDVVQIEVADTGIGVGKEHQELIFEKFYQVGELALHSSGVTKFGGGGPGLGLAIAKGVVEGHGGRIWVQSPDRDDPQHPGSRFFVQIPLMRFGTGPLRAL
jgi:signal transduction histidine kinase